MSESVLAALPRVDALLSHAQELVARYGRRPTADALRRALDDARSSILQGATTVPDAATLLHAAAHDLARRRPGPPRAVVNAAGIVVHTNLGRAPLSPAARAAVLDAAGACDLEYDLETGRRGSRDARLGPLLAEVTGAQAGIAVNNAAAALVLVLATLAAGREVVVSRGELVEIGGSFRLPEIMAAAGARLVEVGTTNRTRAQDFDDAFDRPGADIALLLAVHPSNYRISGFTEAPSTPARAAVARNHGVPLLHDVGSGLLRDRPEAWLADEPNVAESLAAGADLVVCSGDKLLGGPQAGLLVGRADLVERCRRSPLARALRLDKLRIGALVATLEAHLADALDDLPVWRMLHSDAAQIEARARRVASVLPDRTAWEIVGGTTLVGGGSVPGRGVDTPLLRLHVAHPDDSARRLRLGTPAVVARVADDALIVDLRTVEPDDDEVLARRLTEVLQRPAEES